MANDQHLLEARVMRKVTRRLLPFLGLLYFVNYLDRVNIAFAGPNGMNEDLALTATGFGFAAGIFFMVLDLTDKPDGLAALPACVHVRTFPGPAGDPQPRTLIMLRVQGNKRDPSSLTQGLYGEWCNSRAGSNS